MLTDVGLNSSDVIINTTLTSYTFNNLEEYNVYSCVIAAATQVGLGPYSEPIQFTTQEHGKFVLTNTNPKACQFNSLTEWCLQKNICCMWTDVANIFLMF